MTWSKRLPLHLVLAGTVCVFGGETFCLTGPLRYEQIVHVTCHAILYTGIALLGAGAALHVATGFTGRDHS